jgi:hypothetical protein
LFASEDEFVLDTPEQGLFASAHVCNIGWHHKNIGNAINYWHWGTLQQWDKGLWRFADWLHSPQTGAVLH